MKRLFLSVLAVLFLCPIANAITIDFDSIDDGTYTETEFNAMIEGATFDFNGGTCTISDGIFDEGTMALRQDPQEIDPRWEPYRSTIVTFDSLTNYISLDFLCDMPHMVAAFLRLYDEDGAVIATIEQFYEPDEYLYPTQIALLAYQSSTANIASIEFWSDDYNYIQGDGYWDNLSTVAPVPEPATLLLMGGGLIGLAGYTVRFRKSGRK